MSRVSRFTDDDSEGYVSHMKGILEEYYEMNVNIHA